MTAVRGSAHTIVVFLAALALAAPATALEPGVFVDPGSPAGKEYSFPLSVLRGEGTGHAAPAGAAQPLFGVGINPTVRAGTGGTTARSPSKVTAPLRHRHRHSRARSHPATGPTAGDNSRGRRGATALASLVRPSSGVPEIALIAVVLLFVAVASGAGIAAARRRS